MRKKSALIVFLLILILVISGCSGRLRDQERKSIDFRTGTQGLELRFPPNMPTKLFEGDRDVGFILEIRNKGAFPQNDVTEETNDFQARLYFGGFDANILKVGQDSPSFAAINPIIVAAAKGTDFSLEGRSSFNSEGGIQVIPLAFFVERLPPGTSFSVYRPKVRAAVNYRYQTIASPTICVDPQPESATIRDKPCQFTDSIGVGSQGAPVAVTRVDQDVVRGSDGKSKLLYKIFIENVGTGRVLSLPAPLDERDLNTNPFTTGFRFQDLDQVDIGGVSFGRKVSGSLVKANCKPQTKVRLIDNKGVIFCQFDAEVEGVTSAFETPLFINLKYGYQDTVEIELEIREAIEFHAGSLKI